MCVFFPVLTGLRKHEDGWVFEEPVTEDIAPGYGDIIDQPMDYLTIEKKIEKSEYTTKEQVYIYIYIYIHRSEGEKMKKRSL